MQSRYHWVNIKVSARLCSFLENLGETSSSCLLQKPPTVEGNGNPLQYSCLENPTDRETWWATVYGVAKSWTWLSDGVRRSHAEALVCGPSLHLQSQFESSSPWFWLFFILLPCVMEGPCGGRTTGPPGQPRILSFPQVSWLRTWILSAPFIPPCHAQIRFTGFWD